MQLKAWFGCGDRAAVPLKTTVAAPKEVSVDRTTATVISEMERISLPKEEQRTALTAFFALLPPGFDTSFTLLLRSSNHLQSIF